MTIIQNLILLVLVGPVMAIVSISVMTARRERLRDRPAITDGLSGYSFGDGGGCG